MGTKRPFDEDLQEFIKHPKHVDNGNKPDSFEEAFSDGIVEGGSNFIHTDDDQKSEKSITVADMADMEHEPIASLPFPTCITGHEEDAGPGPGPILCSNIFPEFFEFTMPRRQIIHHDDTYSSLLDGAPRKDVPLGPEHQADVPEFDPEVARNHGIKNGNISENESFSNEEVIETSNLETNCECVDVGSIRCVQQHVNEARMKLQESIGLEKFVNLGLNEMGEEVAKNWTEEEEKLFHDVVYSNPVSLGRRFWEQLSIAFPSRTKKELVSYYYNVFMLRRRAVQNRSNLLDIDSDDDEWWGTRRVHSGIRVEDDDHMVVGPFDVHGHGDQSDHDESSSEDDDNNGVGEGECEGDIIIRVQENSHTSFEGHHSPNMKWVEESPGPSPSPSPSVIRAEQEKPVNLNKQEGGLRSESYLHWDPPYSTMGPTKGVDLLPTCSMIEEIFGSSKTGKST